MHSHIHTNTHAKACTLIIQMLIVYTLLFDTFNLCWSDIILTLLEIPISILPEIKDTCGDFGATAKDIFGSEIPKVNIIADQLAKCHVCCWN